MLAGHRVSCGDARIGRQIEAGAPRVIDLGHKANVGQGNLVSNGVAPGEGGEACFDRAKPSDEGGSASWASGRSPAPASSASNLGWVPRARLISTGRSSQNRVSR